MREIETDQGLLPNDYKVYCFSGEPQLILVVTDRATKPKLCFLDLAWNKMSIESEEFKSNEIPVKPDCLEKVIRYARQLSRPFPFVRVDFYVNDNKPILGEMTFTPAACMGSIITSTV